MLARRPELALAPVDASVETIRLIADIDSLRAAQRSATLALIDGDTQTARTLLSNFADQTAVRVENLPMATYPTAIRRAAALIEAGKLDEAKTDLQQTLSTVVVTETVFPYPVINAVLSLAAGEELAAKARKSDEDRAALAIALEAARTSLQRAAVLGYLSPATGRSFETRFARSNWQPLLAAKQNANLQNSCAKCAEHRRVKRVRAESYFPRGENDGLSSKRLSG